MAQQNSNTSDIKANAFVKGMNKDVADMYMSDQSWTHAVNAINNSHLGDTGTIGNEPANYLADSAPYTIIGAAHKSGTEWVIASTNNVDSEIGIFDEQTETYTALVNNQCLGFKKTHLITGQVKENYDCTYSFYFQDNLNPDRALNIDRIPYTTTGNNLSEDPECFIPEYTQVLDCDAIRLHPFVEQPCVTVKKAVGGGQLTNGSYMAVVAYSENGIRLTDYCTPSPPQPIWDHVGIGGSIDVTVDNLDQSFEEYELVIVAVLNQQTVARKVGNYPIRQKKVSLDQINQSLEPVPLAYIPLKNVVYEKSEKMFEVNGYLIRSGVTTQPYFNYQQKANNITVQWVAASYSADYYWGGGNVTGYLRDEVYSFFIRWVYKTGARSASFHIPGRPAQPTDIEPVATTDAIYTNETQRWQVYDTATKAPATGNTTDGGTVAFKGEMAYWESTETYPDDKPEIWGDLCGKPIRHHKMPSNETMHIHSQGGDKIYILGVEFANVAHPLDENGNPILDIVGYEILRGSREGNRSIVAKGLFNNMWEYNIKGNTTKKGLYQNYPYNDLRPDKFLTTDFSTLDDGTASNSTINGAPAPSTYKQNYFSFHSPETNFIKPYLGGNYVKIYTEERGTVAGNFEVPFKHPKHKMLTDGAFAAATIVGLGIALLGAVGKTTGTGGQYPMALSNASPFFSSSRESGIGSIAGDLLNDGIQQAAALGGAGSAASSVAAVAVVVAQGVYFMGQGMSVTLDIIYKIVKFRNYTLQYNSHGFYEKYSAVTNSSVPAGVAPSFRRLLTDDGAKYVGGALQDFDATYRINNNNRNKYVAVNTTANIPNPTSVTDQTRKRLYDGISGVSHKDPFGTFNTTSVAYYGALKLDYQNQYGQLQSIIQLPTDSCVLKSTASTATLTSTPVIFGGDVYINRYTEKNPFYFFNTWLMGEPDGYEIDYRNHVNGPCPRYWADFSGYDLSDFELNISFNPWPNIDPYTPSDLHRFDRPSSGTGAFSLRKTWMYLFYNGVRDFFTESELNMAYRDYGVEDYNKFYDVYGNSFNDLSTMFRSDLIKFPIYYKYDLSLSTAKLFNNFATWGSVLPRDYDPAVYSTCFEYYPSRAIYSLPQQSGMRRDNWRNYLPLNYKDFGGKISTIKSLNAQGAVILFEDAEPVQFMGVDQLQTKGNVKVTVGDGGLFQGAMQGIVNADDILEYASCTASRSAVNTPFGLFFISQKTGKVMQYGGGINEISRDGLKFWFAEHLPSKMLEAYPNFPLYDNPVAGIGCQTTYDQQYELLYFSKKDFIPKRDDFFFDDPTGVPYYICGEITPTPTPPQAPVITEAIANPEASSGCLLDIVIALDSSGSTSGILSPTTVGSAEKNLALAIVNNPAIAAGMAAGLVQIGFTSWAGSPQQISMNPNGFSMSNTVTAAQVNAWYNANWYNGQTAIAQALTHCQSVLSNKAGSQLGDRSSNPDFRQIIVFVTDTQQESGAIAGIGNPYQSSTIPANTIGTPSGPANQFIYAAFAGPTSDIPINPEYLQRISATDGAINAVGGYNYGINASVPASVDQVADAIAAGTCAPSVECNLTASVTAVNEGQQVLLMWSTTSAATATLNGTSVPVNGNAVVLPLDELTTYTLVADDGAGNTSTCIVNIDVEKKQPTPRKCPCAFDDPNCFEPCNWTVSYDPKSKTWISFHDWIPDLNIPAYQHFFTTKDNGIWKHNVLWDQYCEYYGVKHPWEVEFPVVNTSGVTTLRNVEYWMEAYKYYNNGVDYNHVLDENFDTAVIYNSEQNSGILKLNVKPKNDPLSLIAQPVITQYNMEILVAKEENKYRFNMFWDNTNDRGEFTFDQTPMWITNCNGYQRTVNPAYINYNKPPLERKKFRHFGNRVILRKTQSMDKKMILKLGMTKHLNSPR